MLGDEGVVVQLRMSRVDAIYLLKLPGGERFVLVEAGGRSDEALAAKYFETARNCPGEVVERVVDCTVAVGDERIEPEQFRHS